jgi:predicted Rossmann-fold nucleotide-binding protein
MHTQRPSRFPVILVGSDYWKELVQWMQETMDGTTMIAAADLTTFRLVDDAETIVRIVRDVNNEELIPYNHQ